MGGNQFHPQGNGKMSFTRTGATNQAQVAGLFGECACECDIVISFDMASSLPF
jgi:hypothetical protein